MSDGLLPVPDNFELGPTVRGLIEGQQVFARFVLRRVLGRGGMGIVWLAWDQQLERDVALKFLPDIVATDPETIADLKRETRRSLDLTHPHIVRIHDLVQDGATACISMEYVDGKTLSALKVGQSGGCFSVEEIELWVQQLLEALDYAHSRAKVVHRDLKPANLMINAAGELKVADFGIARSISDSVSRVSVRSTSGGTLVYMSPQQAQGNLPVVGDDIYSLGATLYDLLSGKPPFYSGNIQHQLESIVPVPMAERRAGLGNTGTPIPPEWEETVAACLAKEAAQRPQSVREVAERLGFSVAGTVGTRRNIPVETPPPAPPVVLEEIPSPAPLPKKSRAALVSVILLLLAAGAALGWYFGIEKPAEEDQIRQAQIAQQEAIDKEKQLEAQQAADAQQKAADEAAAKAKADADAATAAQAAADKAKADAAAAAAAQAAADKAKADAAAATAAQATGYPQDGQPWTNSLGMKFVPAGTDGVLFSVWDTRVVDYQAFVTETGRDWPKSDITQTENDPAVNVSWDDAHAFCYWLTKKEQAERKLGPNQSYRLPTDAEWSKAVGLNESVDGTPASKNEKIAGVYPWGTQWPPPQGAGNYEGEDSDAAGIKGYRDGYAFTSPVGSFAANQYGLYDMGGNVWQWCEDWYDTDQQYRTLRGASCKSSDSNFLLSSYRDRYPPGVRDDDRGFRCVLVVSAPQAAASPAPGMQPFPPPPPLPEPSSPPAAINIDTQTYTVVAGDSLWKIAHKFYPNDTKDGIDKIKDANQDTLITGQPMKIGQVLIIPPPTNP